MDRGLANVQKGLCGYPEKAGLYDPGLEKDACGVGFVANIKGKASHKTLKDSKTLLCRMAHRGAVGCEANTGDGAGVMTAIPHEFFKKVTQGVFEEELPAPGKYAVGNVFFHGKDVNIRVKSQQHVEKIAKECRLHIIGWRDVPTDNSSIGDGAKSKEPFTSQVFVRTAHPEEKESFTKLVYIFKKQCTERIPYEDWFYICTLNTKTIVYKGQLTTDQVFEYFPDLRDEDFKTHFALVHSRFSTNTFPSWDRAQPLRVLGHNGEINTVRGNVNWMRAREGSMASTYFGTELHKVLPVVEGNGSDSGCFDNALEFMLMNESRTLPEIMMMLVPEAWENDKNMDSKKKAFYKYNSTFMEAWDGPALFAFCDSRYIGAILDRNGLRPSRYYVTNDDHMIMASEVGVLDIKPETIIQKGRLQPGKMLLVDTEKGIIVKDEVLKKEVSNSLPFEEWLDKNLITLDKLLKGTGALKEGAMKLDDCSVVEDKRVQLFGYSVEHVNMLILPMIQNGKEALGSMGNDAPLACMSKFPKLVFEYFKQLFAQVTNPPIDPFREKIIMSARSCIGPQGNVLYNSPELAARLELESPVLSCEELYAVKNCAKYDPSLKVKTIDMTFNKTEGESGLSKCLDRISVEAMTSVTEGYKYIILSDRSVSETRVPAPSLLAVGAVHQYLIQEKARLKVGLILESGEPREVHHMCTLLGFGVDAVCPYMVFELVAKLGRENSISDAITVPEIVAKYKSAIDIGIRKVMAKMGISTLQSYKGAQIFEAVGLKSEVIEKCFTRTASRVEGVGFDVLALECLSRHELAYPQHTTEQIKSLQNPGDYHWVDGGEEHINDPEAIAQLQDAVRMQNGSAYEKYAAIEYEKTKACTLRGMLEFKYENATPIPLEEVEPASEIVKRFCTGAMSYGSISKEAHETLAIAMNRLQGKSNTGEGGEDKQRWIPLDNGDSKRSAIKQVASGRFGVTVEYLVNSDEIQIKMAQGAKPGEGGELPGHKVTKEIADTRHSTPGVGLISPPPHHDIYSIEDLAELIYDLKVVNPTSRISVKLVSEVGVGVIASGVAKGHADHILISGHDGGTGASSWTGVKNAGLPWELGLAETHQTLVMNKLRGRVVIQTDGQMRTGRDVVIATMLGAEEYGLSTVPLIAMGCTMMRKCHLNTCPVGIATQDPELRKKFSGQPEHVVNFFFMMAEEARGIMAKLGLRTIDEMVGRCDLLMKNEAIVNRKTAGLKLDLILQPATELRPGVPVICSEKQDHGLERRLEESLKSQVAAVIASKKASVITTAIQNTDRVFGTTTSNMVTKQYGDSGLPDGCLRFKLKGSAGQSLGAFLCKGVSIELEGDSNDYVGKGLSGGEIVVYPSKYNEAFVPRDNIIVGNVCLYGATSGRAFIRGVTAERFCVRNSGAIAVCEGVGDHGCEYMTGGRTIVLGRTGRNFAAGMSGGIAYVLNENKTFERLCNTELVDLCCVEEEEESMWLRGLVQDHMNKTGSKIAEELLNSWSSSVKKFVKVYPREYKKVLEAQKEAQKQAEPSVLKDVTTEENASAANAANSTAGLEDIEDTIADKDMEARAEARAKSLDKLRGFMKYKRKADGYRNPKARIGDFNEISRRHKIPELRTQAARCMDCGVPFCQSANGCPLGNIIPKWNDLVFKERWEEALNRLLLTNNFPEFTGRVCPAPCEGACTLGINAPAVSIKSIECAIIDKGFEKGWIVPKPPKVRTDKKIAIVGSGPAGLAAADMLNRCGHNVTVYERNDRVGGLLMYGIPNMKLDKKIVERRVNLLADEGIKFVTNTEIGRDLSCDDALKANDILLLACGATWPRDLPIPGRNLDGIHFAMNYLEPNTKKVMDPEDTKTYINAKDKNVVVIGGGDTGNDCIGTAIRQGAKSIITFEILPQPPEERSAGNPWPTWPKIFRVDYGHEEVQVKMGYDPRRYSTCSKKFIGDENGNVKAIETIQVRWDKDEHGRWKMVELPDTVKVYEADLVFISMGFIGPESTISSEIPVELDPRTNFKTPQGAYNTSVDRVYACGDCRRGQSLIVWAINEGRQAAAQIDHKLRHCLEIPRTGGVFNKMDLSLTDSAVKAE
eukprot:Nk52_evm27s2579 gene=Nk52_evmTU27s2579